MTVSQQFVPDRSAVADLVDRIAERWRSEGDPDARTALAEYPELADDKDAIVDLAYEEYCLREDAGEVVDREAFLDAFPECKASLGRLLRAHSFLRDNSQLGDELREVSWPTVGSTFLGFELRAELGRGSFSRVYLATEAELGNRAVVVKVSPRGQSEARILGPLDHPNIVSVHTVKHDPGSQLSAVVMPFRGTATFCDILDALGGEKPNLAKPASFILDAVKLRDDVPTVHDESSTPWLGHGSYGDAIVHYGIRLADALAFLHRRGIYHRDLKPSNVLVSPSGRPMLLDFNLSAEVHAPSHVVGGTIPYMSPEQLEALRTHDQGRLDGRADIYSLGVILCELLLGEHPFGPLPQDHSVESLQATMLDRQRSSSIDALPLRSDVAQVIRRCLALDPNDRFSSAEELASALRGCVSPAARARRWLARHTIKIAACVTLAAVMVGASVAYVRARDPYHVRQYRQGVAQYQAGDYAGAVDTLSEVVSDFDEKAAPLIWRGRAWHQQGNYKKAIDDFQAADDLVEDVELKACIGFCASKLARPARASYPAWTIAILHHREAIEAGLKDITENSPKQQRKLAAAVYNNLAWDLMEQPVPPQTKAQQRKEAEKWLRKALALNTNLQAPNYNFARLCLAKRANHTIRVVPKDALRAMERALSIGPDSVRLYWDAARLFAYASKENPLFVGKALECLEKAVQCGGKPKVLLRDFVFESSPLRGLESYERLKNRKPGIAVERSLERLVDPLGKHSPGEGKPRTR